MGWNEAVTVAQNSIDKESTKSSTTHDHGVLWRCYQSHEQVLWAQVSCSAEETLGGMGWIRRGSWWVDRQGISNSTRQGQQSTSNSNVHPPARAPQVSFVIKQKQPSMLDEAVTVILTVFLIAIYVWSCDELTLLFSGFSSSQAFLEPQNTQRISTRLSWNIYEAAPDPSWIRRCSHAISHLSTLYLWSV